MPSKQLRIAITPSPELRTALEELAEASELPVATLVVRLLDELRPSLLDMAKFARHAKAGKKAAAKRALQHMVGNALAEYMVTTQGVLKEVK